MSRNITKKYSKNFDYENRTWSKNGEEQQLLEQMFEDGRITEKDSANSVRQIEPLFQKFSAQVFSSHFRKTKNNINLDKQYLANSPGILSEVFGNSSSNPTPPKKIHNSSSIIDSVDENSVPVQFLNPPVCKWCYVDHIEKSTKVCVAVAMIAGADDIRFELTDDGKYVKIEYSWPTAIFRADELFGDEIKNKDPKVKIDPSHPKVHSLTSELLNIGITENSAPKGCIVVELPITVQKEIGTWKKSAVKKPNGTKIVLLEFKGFQPKQIICDADTSISFD